MLKISKTISKSTEIKERFNEFILTCNYCEKYKDSSVLFTVEKRLPAFSWKYVIASLFFSFSLCMTNFSLALVLASLFCIFYLLLKFSYTVKKETVYLLVPVGLQLNATFFFGTKSSTFIPWSIIQDFLIVEVISRQTVIYCLIVLIKDIDGTRFVTIFENTKPKLKVLEKVYSTLQSILISQKKTDCESR